MINKLIKFYLKIYFILIFFIENLINKKIRMFSFIMFNWQYFKNLEEFVYIFFFCKIDINRYKIGIDRYKLRCIKYVWQLDVKV